MLINCTEMFKPKFIFAAAAAMLLSVSAIAGDAAKEALPFLRIERDPAKAAMGFAGAASTSSIAYSSFTNAAVIPFWNGKFDAGVSYQNWAPDGVKSTNFAGGVGFKATDYLGFSVGFAMQKGEKYDEMDIHGAYLGKYTPKDMIVSGGVGVKITDVLGVGLNLRYARQALASDTKHSTIAGDLMVYYKPLENLGLTAGVASLGKAIKGGDDKMYDIPASIKVAGEYTAALTEEHSVKGDLDVDYFLYGKKLCAALGGEYSYKNLLFARAGFHLGSDEAVLPTFVTLGAGVKFKGLRLDLGYLTANKVIGNTITIGLGYSF